MKTAISTFAFAESKSRFKLIKFRSKFLSIFRFFLTIQNIRYERRREIYQLDYPNKDLESWLTEPSIVILTLFDAQNEIAYYLNVQKYFVDNHLTLADVNKYLQVSIDKTQIFEAAYVQQLRIQKNQKLWI